MRASEQTVPAGAFSRYHYMEQKPLVRAVSRIKSLEHDTTGSFVLLENTVFHPQGGGQRADRGHIAQAQVTHVAKLGDSPANFEVKHYVVDVDHKNLAIGQEVDLEIDTLYREQNSKLHSAGHLLAAVAESLFSQLQAISGHHYPGEGRVEFKNRSESIDLPSMDDLKMLIDEELALAIAKNYPVHVLWDDAGRKISTGPFAPVPCGGTHVSQVSDLGGISIRNVKLKRGIVVVGYDML